MFADWVITSPSMLVVFAMLVLLISCIIVLRAARTRITKPSRWWGVITLNLIAYCTIALLLWQPMKPREVTGAITLVTDRGFESDAKDGYAAPGVLHGGETAGLTPLPSVQILPMREPDLATLNLQGHGLSASDLAALPGDIQVNWQAPALSGLTDVRWRKSLPLGDKLFVSASYHAPEGREGDIFTAELKDPAGNTVEQARLKSGDRFVLEATPKLQGPLMYSLTLADRLGTPLQQENIPVSVQMPARVSMLVVQSAPSFEARHLLEWAARFDAELSVHTRISKDRYIRQASEGTEDTGLPPLSSPSLASTDFLLLDGRMLTLMSADERTQLEEAITNGLGVLVIADSALLGGLEDTQFSPLSGFRTAAIESQTTSAVPVWAGSANEIALPILPMQLAHPDAEVLIRAATGRALTLATNVGLGKFVLTTLRDRHVWATSGDNATFANYWSFILSNIARQGRDHMLLPQAESTIARVQEMVPLCLLSKNEAMGLKIEAMTGDLVRHTRATQTSTLSPHHCAFFQSDTPGWYQISLEISGTLADDTDVDTADAAYIYLHGRDEWRTDDQFKRQNASKRYLALRQTEGQDGVSRDLLQKAIPTFWLWLILVVSASLLWLERKLD